MTRIRTPSLSVASPPTAPVLLNMDAVRIDPVWALKVPAALAQRRRVLPFSLVDNKLYVACADLSDAPALEAVERFAGHRVTPVLAEPTSLQRALGRVFGDGGRTSATSAETASPDDPVALCDEVFHAAILRQASDIHIEPTRENVRVRFRVDGILEPYRSLPSAAFAGLMSRFKVLAGMDIAEKRAPQDGGFTHMYGSGTATRKLDIRAATLPTKYGEKMTLRLLALQTEGLTLERLGMDEQDLQLLQTVLDQPHGLILLTGPTGSGKTTTLYGAIRRLIRHGDLNIITVEDPIEYDIPGVAQVEVDAVDKVSFNKALRSVLRHDPDVVMIGEIRDMDTLDVAVKASLTGHLVLSTLHTNSAASSVTRLRDMGLQTYLIAATLRLAIAQRLVRRLCDQCRVPRPMTTAEAMALGDAKLAGQKVYEPQGCMCCAGKGFVGRIGLFELMRVDNEIAGLISAGGDEAKLTQMMRQEHQRTLLEDALRKVLTGQTTVKEVLQAVVGA
jgi:type IV pilus assembly protein PilB